MQQIVEIAKALIARPRILILDEPSAVLSAHETAILFRKIREFSAAGATVLYISHRLDEIFEISDDAFVLKDGLVVLSAETSAVQRDDLIRAMVGRSLDAVYPARHPHVGEIALEVRGLSRGSAFKDVSFTSAPARSSACSASSAAAEPKSPGRCSAPSPPTAAKSSSPAGRSVISSPPRCHRPWHGVRHRRPQARRFRLDSPFSTMAPLPRWPGSPVPGCSIGRPGAKSSSSKLDELDVRPRGVDRPVRKLSGGNQQKVVLAKWLLVEDIRIFIFDEPTRGVDIATKVEIYRMLAELAAAGRAILLISSEMPEVLGMSDRLIVSARRARRGCSRSPGLHHGERYLLTPPGSKSAGRRHEAGVTTTTGEPPPAQPSRFARLPGVSLANVGFAVAILTLVIVASIASDVFLTERNIVSISRQIVTNGLLSLGMLLVILTGGIDLSVGPVVAFAGLLAAGLQAHVPFPAAIAVALGMGLAVGVFNGFMIARFGLQPFIVTLATMGSLRGLLYVYSETPQYPADPLFRSLLGGGFIGPFPVPSLVPSRHLPIVWFYLNHTVSGRAVYAIGVNAEAVRLAGINVRRHLIAAYVACGFLAALGRACCSPRAWASPSRASASATSSMRSPRW